MENQSPKNAEEAAKIIEDIYKPIIKKQVANAFIMGGKAAFKILYQNFVEDIIYEKISDEEIKEKTKSLIQYIKNEYDNIETDKKDEEGND